MKLCIPTTGNEGLKASVSGHFGSAPHFTIYDTDSEEIIVIDNQNLHHTHGNCQPLRALSGVEIDAVVCGGMGAGAIFNLNQGGIRAYLGQEGTVQEIAKAFQEGNLPELTPSNACSQHGCHN
ncbi:MAG: NifB/NifX family molybdenum-iron cluster-binding protein [Bacillota bacterium]|nr:NifB/NifX family molybdenum-iron cluster-binding protein [Bacillota bacterium]